MLRRAQSRAGQWLAQQAGAALAGVEAETIVIAGGGGEPPRFTTGLPAPTALSISHSGGTVVAAAAFGARGIGLDVQGPRPRAAETVVGQRGWQRFFQAYTPPASPAGADRVIARWTLWEAAVKCDGSPLLAATTPAFEALLGQRVPGTEGSWRSQRYWALSRRLDDVVWLALIGHDDSDALPEVEWREFTLPAAY